MVEPASAVAVVRGVHRRRLLPPGGDLGLPVCAPWGPPAGGAKGVDSSATVPYPGGVDSPTDTVQIDPRPTAPAVAPGDEAGQVLVLDVAVDRDGGLVALLDTDLGLILAHV